VPLSVKATVPPRFALFELVLAVNVRLCPNTVVEAEVASAVVLVA